MWACCACMQDGSALSVQDIELLRQQHATHRPEDSQRPELERSKPGFEAKTTDMDDVVFEWSVCLQRGTLIQNLPIGLKVQAHAEQTVLVVWEVLDGQSMVAIWNRSCRSPRERIKVGDVFLRVNDVFGDSDKMLDEVTSCAQATIQLRRCTEFTVAVRKTTNMGLTMSKTRFMVQHIGEGLVANYNKRCPSERQVHKGDIITSVNGVIGEPTKLLQAVAEATEEIKMVILRPE